MARVAHREVQVAVPVIVTPAHAPGIFRLRRRPGGVGFATVWDAVAVAVARAIRSATRQGVIAVGAGWAIGVVEWARRGAVGGAVRHGRGGRALGAGGIVSPRVSVHVETSVQAIGDAV